MTLLGRLLDVLIQSWENGLKPYLKKVVQNTEQKKRKISHLTTKEERQVKKSRSSNTITTKEQSEPTFKKPETLREVRELGNNNILRNNFEARINLRTMYEVKSSYNYKKNNAL